MERNLWDPQAPRVGERAPDLDLLDESGRPFPLSSVGSGGPLLVLLFGDGGDELGRSLLLDYRDTTLSLQRAGVSLCAVAKADPATLRYMRMERGLAFPMLADPDGASLSRWGMIDRVGLFLLDRNFIVKQRAPGTRAPADALLTFVRRGGAKSESGRKPLSAKLRLFWQSLQHAFRPLRPVR
jgi:peroxiredoxin Q/BCP